MNPEGIVQPILEVRRIKMINTKYSICVYPYLMGQFRIQLCSDEEADLGPTDENHGQIVREMCTYNQATMHRKVVELAMSNDPEKLARSWATEKNCEDPERGRIRLDQ